MPRWPQLIALTLICASICASAAAESIVFPAFDRPLIKDRLLVSHHTFGTKVIAIDRSTKWVRWTATAPDVVHRLYLTQQNEIAVAHESGITLLDSSNGEIIRTFANARGELGLDGHGRFYSCDPSGVITCWRLDPEQRIWMQDFSQLDSNAFAQLADDYVFAALTPKVTDGQITRGVNRIVHLAPSSGEVLAEEDLPLSETPFGVRIKAEAGPRWIFCATQESIRLYPRLPGSAAHQLRTGLWLDAAAFYGDDSMVLCQEGSSEDQRLIRVLEAPSFRTRRSFTIENVPEVATADVVGDVLLLGSLCRTVAVDLKSKSVIWRKGQRHQTIHEGRIYYGESIVRGREQMRVLGVCDPRTGRDTVLYLERVTK